MPSGSHGSQALRTTPRRIPTTAERATKTAKRTTAFAARTVSSGSAQVRARLLKRAADRRLASFMEPRRLCLGSGDAPIPGWINIDFEPPADVLLDLRYGIPVPAGSIDAIYSEHLVEHLLLDDAIELFRECRRILSRGGVMRVATPDLEALVSDYRNEWRSGQEWITWPQYGYIDTPVRMINVAMREWGHRYLYDYDELAQRLREAGFMDVKRVALGDSGHEKLRGLETRADSRLIVEAS